MVFLGFFKVKHIALHLSTQKNLNFRILKRNPVNTLRNFVKIFKSKYVVKKNITRSFFIFQDLLKTM